MGGIVLIDIKGLQLAFGEKVVFDDVGCLIGDRARMGLVGNNGAGKTTLLRVLTGEIEPDGGRVERSRGLRVGYLPQDLVELELVPVLDFLKERVGIRFKQTDADVGSFDAGYGSALLARQIGDKRAREIFFLARTYDAVTAERWGVINEAVPHAELEERALEYAAIVAGKSPQAIRMLKLAFNLADDGLAGQQVFAGEATRLAYMTAVDRKSVV